MKPNPAPDPLNTVRDTIKACMKCNLRDNVKAPVPLSAGSSRTRGLLIIGEAPGQDEDENGIPFIGKSGRYLRGKLRECGVETSITSFCNVVSCRPPNNRNPKPGEIAACRFNLLAQIRVTEPRVILSVGKVAATALNPDLMLLHDAGRPVYYIPEKTILIPTYHPAYILRNRAGEPAWVRDLTRVKEHLYGKLLSPWPDDCRFCRNAAVAYDSFGLAYCGAHRKDARMRVVQESFKGLA